MQMSLEKAEAEFNIDPKIVAAAREAGVKDISYNGAVDKSEVSEIFMVVEDIGAAEKFQEQSGGAARIVSSRGLEHYQKGFADYLAQSDPKDTDGTTDKLDQFYGRAMDYASGKSVDSAEDFGWMEEMVAEEDARHLNERNAHKLREAARLLQGGAGDAAGSEDAGQLEAVSKDAAEDAVKDAPKDAAEHAEKNTGEHAVEHAQEKSEHRGELGQFFDNLVEHHKQRENPEGEAYLSEGVDKNIIASQLEYSWMQDAKSAVSELDGANYPGAAAIGGALSDFRKECADEMLEAAKNDDWKSFQEVYERAKSEEAEFLEQLEAGKEFAVEDLHAAYKRPKTSEELNEALEAWKPILADSVDGASDSGSVLHRAMNEVCHRCGESMRHITKKRKLLTTPASNHAAWRSLQHLADQGVEPPLGSPAAAHIPSALDCSSTT